MNRFVKCSQLRKRKKNNSPTSEAEPEPTAQSQSLTVKAADPQVISPEPSQPVSRPNAVAIDVAEPLVPEPLEVVEIKQAEQPPAKAAEIISSPGAERSDPELPLIATIKQPSTKVVEAPITEIMADKEEPDTDIESPTWSKLEAAAPLNIIPTPRPETTRIIASPEPELIDHAVEEVVNQPTDNSFYPSTDIKLTVDQPSAPPEPETSFVEPITAPETIHQVDETVASEIDPVITEQLEEDDAWIQALIQARQAEPYEEEAFMNLIDSEELEPVTVETNLPPSVQTVLKEFMATAEPEARDVMDERLVELNNLADELHMALMVDEIDEPEQLELTEALRQQFTELLDELNLDPIEAEAVVEQFINLIIARAQTSKHVAEPLTAQAEVNYEFRKQRPIRRRSSLARSLQRAKQQLEIEIARLMVRISTATG